MIRLERSLSNGYFRSEDFQVGQEDYGSAVTKVTVSYRHDSNYILTAEFDSSKQEVITETETPSFGSLLGANAAKIRRSRQQDPITGEIRPGEICDPEEFGAKSFKAFIDVLTTWLSNVRAELDAGPKWRETTTWREGIEQAINELKDEQAKPGEMFDAEEAREFRGDLDNLEAKLNEALKSMIENNEELEKRVQSLHTTVEFLKEQVERLDKPSMMRAVVARVYGWLQHEDNRKFLGDGVKAAQLVADLYQKSGL